MARIGMWARLVLLMAALLLTCACAQAEEAALEILSCEQQGETVVLDFVCLDENNAPVMLPLQPGEWTVRGAASLTDMQVMEVRRYQGGVHYVFVYEASGMVGGDGMYTQLHCIEAMKACADSLKSGDSMSVVQLGSQMQMVLNREEDRQTIKDALGRLKKESSGNSPALYDRIDEAVGQLKRRADERTVMFILATGVDKDSKLTRFELAQRLENAQLSVYPVLVRGYRNAQNATGLEALCVRGGYMLRADRVKNKDGMAAALTALLPVVRDSYTLTARATDTSYNGQSDMALRVYVRHHGRKISGEASLTTDDKLYTVVEPTVTAVPQVTDTATAEPTVTATSEVTVPPTAAPVLETSPTPTAAVPASEPTDHSVLPYVLLGGGVLAVLLVVTLVAGTLVRGAKRKKAKRLADNRPATKINPQFGPTKTADASAPKAEPVAAKAEKPAVAPVQPVKQAETPQQTPITNPAELFDTPHPQEDIKPSAAQAAPAQSVWEKTMDERQMYQQPAPSPWEKTMDERQMYQQPAPPAWEPTKDEVKPVAQRSSWDETRDERQVQQPVAAAFAPAAVGAEQMVTAASAGPQLVLSITDAEGTREVSRPLLTGGEITLGRENTDILLNSQDHSISRSHMSIKLTASNLTVVDHSGNGTMVDGQMLRHGEAKLTIGSEMRLGGLDEAVDNRVTTVIRVKEFRFPGASR